MPFNGSGVYNPPSLPGSFNPATTGQQATPADWTTLLADFVAAWNLCLTRDGLSTVSANIPMAGFKLTGLGAGTAVGDAINLGQTRLVPVIKTVNFVLNPDTDRWVINDKPGTAIIVTLPNAATYAGLELHFQNYQATAVSSASGNVRSVEGNPLAVTIVSAIAGAWATIVSDGTNWRQTQRGT